MSKSCEDRRLGRHYCLRVGLEVVVSMSSYAKFTMNTKYSLLDLGPSVTVEKSKLKGYVAKSMGDSSQLYF